MENTWVTYNEGVKSALKTVEAEMQRVSLRVTPTEAGYTLTLEAGIESVSVNLKSTEMSEACAEADLFAKDYYRDKARLFEEIADRI